MERTVVGRDQLEVVLQEPLPQLVLVRRRSQRRRADVLRALEARATEVVEAEVEVLRAGFGKRWGTVVARLAHGVERLFGTEMHDVDRDLREASERDGTSSGLRLHAGRPREPVVNRVSFALCQVALH